MRCHSLRILAWTWFWCFWALLICLFGGYFLHMSSTAFVEEATAIWWRNVIFVAAAVGSMAYVRFGYYPWLMAKKRDPVLPVHRSPQENLLPAHALSQPLEISLL